MLVTIELLLDQEVFVKIMLTDHAGVYEGALTYDYMRLVALTRLLITRRFHHLLVAVVVDCICVTLFATVCTKNHDTFTLGHLLFINVLVIDLDRWNTI